MRSEFIVFICLALWGFFAGWKKKSPTLVLSASMFLAMGIVKNPFGWPYWIGWAVLGLFGALFCAIYIFFKKKQREGLLLAAMFLLMSAIILIDHM